MVYLFTCSLLKTLIWQSCRQKVCSQNKVLNNIFGANVTPYDNTKNVTYMCHALGQITWMIISVCLVSACERGWTTVFWLFLCGICAFLFAPLFFFLHSVAEELTWCLCSCLGNIYSKGHFYSYILLWLLDRWMLMFSLCTALRSLMCI